MKGNDKYHGGRKETMARENVIVQRGWVSSSGNRRDYLFAQLEEHMSPEGVENYAKLNNLGARARALLRQLRLLPRASLLQDSCVCVRQVWTFRTATCGRPTKMWWKISSPSCVPASTPGRSLQMASGHRCTR